MSKATPGKPVSAAAMVEYIVGCKWSMRILNLIRTGVNRPGAITRALEGLTTKVQGDCLTKMVSFGILERTAYPEIPPRVEYRLTHMGEHFIAILDALVALQQEIDAASQPSNPGSATAETSTAANKR